MWQWLCNTLVKHDIMKKIILLLVTISPVLFITSCSQEKKLLRKASVAVDSYDYDKAIYYYDQVLVRDSNSFYGNAGKGIVLSEYMDKYDKAIPYLEKALKKSPQKNLQKINTDLGRSYHYIGSYDRALYFYAKATRNNNEDNPDYDVFLSKRIADCKYAIEHPQVNPPELQYVKNVGTPINTSFPEYGPIYVNGNLIFTAQRQDSPKEKKNGVSQRYYESMYIAPLKKDGFSSPRRYTLPDYAEDSKFRKGGEAALSASSDGKTLFLFKEGKIYEANLEDSTKREQKLPGNINFSNFQGYAFVTSDGKTLLFTSESKSGRGGTDIYRAEKMEDGKWSDPKLLSYMINTDYNEDAPFMTEDGVLYFASNGLPGYGGYDVYKTHLEDGQWTTPENLGQPINTPGDDIYFMLKPNSSNGFYSSNRMGGNGDMDIYYVHYATNDISDCKVVDSSIVIQATPSPTNEMSYVFMVNVPAKYENNVRTVNWTVNGEPIGQTGEKVEYVFTNPSACKVTAKMVVYCDSCPRLISVCADRELIVGQPILVQNNEPTVIKEAKPVIDKSKTILMDGIEQLSNNRLNELGWNNSGVYFDYNEYSLREDAKMVLDQDINVLKKNKDLTLIINGYADSRGSNGYNERLSGQRANMVKNYFILKGISQYRITTVNAYGESRISNGCKDDVDCSEEQHQINRKVDFNVNTSSKVITGNFRP